MTHEQLCQYYELHHKQLRLHGTHFDLLYKRLERITKRMAKFDDDVAALATAVADDEAAIAAIQTLTASLGDKITQLEAQVAAGSPDLTKMESLITQLRGDNQKLADIANTATPPAPPPPVAG